MNTAQAKKVSDPLVVTENSERVRVSEEALDQLSTIYTAHIANRLCPQFDPNNNAASECIYWMVSRIDQLQIQLNEAETG